MAYDADGAGAGVARVPARRLVQAGHLRRAAPAAGRQAGAGSCWADCRILHWSRRNLDERPGGDAGPLVVLPLRGPAVGAFRTGWRHAGVRRMAGSGPGAGPAAGPAGGRRLAEELVRSPWPPALELAGPGGRAGLCPSTRATGRPAQGSGGHLAGPTAAAGSGEPLATRRGRLRRVILATSRILAADFSGPARASQTDASTPVPTPPRRPGLSSTAGSCRVSARSCPGRPHDEVPPPVLILLGSAAWSSRPVRAAPPRP